MNLIDTHAHIDLPEFSEDQTEVIQRSTANSVTRIINIGATRGLNGAYNSIKLSENYTNIFCSIGIHPNDASMGLDFNEIIKLSDNHNVIAIGETGLDFYHERATSEDQYKLFDQHINLAADLKKPLIIHSRNTAQECIDHLKKYSDKNLRGVFHCFTYDYEIYSQAIDLGFIISLTGIVTFKNAPELQSLAKKIDLNTFMLETDAPYMAPAPNRGKRNEPGFVLDIAKKIAELREISLEEVAKTTTNTAEKFFNLKPLP